MDLTGVLMVGTFQNVFWGILILKGLGSLSSRLLLHGDECFDNDFETGEDRVEVEGGGETAFLGDDNFLLASNLVLSFFYFFSFLKSGVIFFLFPQRSIHFS